MSPHINYYHSYRGDSRGVRGFGKDITLMRQIIDKIDEIEDSGLCNGIIRMTWDYADTYWSMQLQKEYQQDVLDRVIERFELPAPKGAGFLLLRSLRSKGRLTRSPQA